MQVVDGKVDLSGLGRVSSQRYEGQEVVLWDLAL